MTQYWNTFKNWIENGDLVPYVIVISIPHYTNVLAEFEWMPVAAALGFLVDIGHYRTILAYRRNKGSFWMVMLTFVSFGFHTAFYYIGGAAVYLAFPLGLVVPILLFALAFLSHREGWGRQAKKDATIQRQDNGDLSATSGKSDWRHLTPEERAECANLATDEILKRYPIAARTAREWRSKAQNTVRTPSVSTAGNNREGE